MNNHTYKLAFLSLGLALALPLHAHAQTMSYDGSGHVDGGDDDGGEGDGRKQKRGRSGKSVTVTPYLEAAQVATAELSPGSDFLTYTSLAAGVDAQFNGRNTKGAASVRYERRIGYGRAADGDTISGIVRWCRFSGQDAKLIPT